MVGATSMSTDVHAKSLFLIIFLKIGCGWCSLSTTENGNSGTFFSPDHPSNYRNNAEWLYIARLTNSGPQEVRLDYKVDLNTAGSCEDYVWIPDLSQKLCGATQGSVTISIEGSEFNMTFRSDSSGSGPGFTINFTAIEGPCHPLLHLPLDYSFEKLPILDLATRRSVTMRCKVCWNLHFALAANPTLDNNFLVIVVGGWSNTFNVIRQNCETFEGSCRKASRSSGPLDCDNFVGLWLDWGSNSIKVGTGDVIGTSILLSYDGPINDVNYFSMTGWGNSSPVVDCFVDAPFPPEYCAPSTPAATTSTEVTTTDSVVTTTITDAITSTEATTTGQGPVVSTPASVTPVTYTRDQRPCTCIQQEVPSSQVTQSPEEKEEAEEMKEKIVMEIKRNLTLPKVNISATVRRHISAKDGRSSSTYIGVVMGVICFMPLAIILLSDCLTLLATVTRMIVVQVCLVYKK